jgi:hypothetical protein
MLRRAVRITNEKEEDPKDNPDQDCTSRQQLVSKVKEQYELK